jgi:hypothetical protein
MLRSPAAPVHVWTTREPIIDRRVNTFDESARGVPDSTTNRPPYAYIQQIVVRAKVECIK